MRSQGPFLGLRGVKWSSSPLGGTMSQGEVLEGKSLRWNALLAAESREDTIGLFSLKPPKPLHTVHGVLKARIFIGRTDAEAEALILWLPDAKSQLIGKDPDSGKDWRQKEEGEAEDEWVWANPGRWWRAGKPGMQQSMGLQRLGHDLATEQQQSLFRTSYQYCNRAKMQEKMQGTTWCFSMPGGLCLSWASVAKKDRDTQFWTRLCLLPCQHLPFFIYAWGSPPLYSLVLIGGEECSLSLQMISPAFLFPYYISLGLVEFNEHSSTPSEFLL